MLLQVALTRFRVLCSFLGQKTWLFSIVWVVAGRAFSNRLSSVNWIISGQCYQSLCVDHRLPAVSCSPHILVIRCNVRKLCRHSSLFCGRRCSGFSGNNIFVVDQWGNSTRKSRWSSYSSKRQRVFVLPGKTVSLNVKQSVAVIKIDIPGAKVRFYSFLIQGSLRKMYSMSESLLIWKRSSTVSNMMME